MKTNQTIRTVGNEKLSVEAQPGATPSSSRFQPSIFTQQLAFTLIELLVVITIIGVLAAFLFTVAGVVAKTKYISMTKAEMGKIESAIESYHNDRNFYPPSNPGDAKTPPLYYELLGTTINGANYVTLDNSAQIPIAQVANVFGVNGFVNCTRTNAVAEDASPAKSYLAGLKPQEFGIINTNSASPFYNVALLLGAAGGPDKNYQPLNNSANQNPWRYKSPGTYNPGSYDLWMQLVIGGKTNLVCNWSKQVQINYPLP